MGKEIMIPKPESTDLMANKGSLLDAYQKNLLSRYDNFQSLMDRIEKKQHIIANFIHDGLTAEATKANLKLQRQVTYLTWGLILLTIVLVVLTGILVYNSLI